MQLTLSFETHTINIPSTVTPANQQRPAPPQREQPRPNKPTTTNPSRRPRPRQWNGRVLPDLPSFIPPPPPLPPPPQDDNVRAPSRQRPKPPPPSKSADDEDDAVDALFLSVEDDEKRPELVSTGTGGLSNLSPNLSKTISSNSGYSYNSDLDVDAIIADGFDLTEGRGIVTMTTLGTITQLPSADGTRMGKIQSDDGTVYEFGLGILKSQHTALGQICTFSSTRASGKAQSIMPSMSVPVARVEQALNTYGQSKWDAPMYLLDSCLAVRGSDNHNEYYEKCDDLFDTRWQDEVERTLNAFINTEGGTMFIGVNKTDKRVSGVLLTVDEQEEILRLIERVTTEEWKPPIPNRSDVVRVDFVPLCSSKGMICRHSFVVRISIHSPIFRDDGSQVTFSYLRNNNAFRRNLGFNVVLSKFNRATPFPE